MIFMIMIIITIIPTGLLWSWGRWENRPQRRCKVKFSINMNFFVQCFKNTLISSKCQTMSSFSPGTHWIIWKWWRREASVGRNRLTRLVFLLMELIIDISKTHDLFSISVHSCQIFLFQVHFTTITSGLKLLMEKKSKKKMKIHSWNVLAWIIFRVKKLFQIINCLNSLCIVLACTVPQKNGCFFLNHYQNVVFI